MTRVDAMKEEEQFSLTDQSTKIELYLMVQTAKSC